MRFHIENDTGNAIVGWLVPDNPLATSRVAVALGGRRVAEVPASVVLPDIKGWGWHSTGLCAFVINEEVVPGLTASERVELYDVDTNVLLWRRPLGGETVRKKLLLLTPEIQPATALQSALFPHFHMAYLGAGNLSEETLIFIVDNMFTQSLLVSGNLLFARYEDRFYKNGYVMSVLVGDAFVELARRILWLRRRAGLDEARRWRNAHLAAPTAFSAALPLGDPAALRKAFRGIDQPTYAALSNPLTRMLACKLPGERLEHFHPTQALEALSRFDIVGHRDFWGAYASTVFGQLAIPGEPPEAPPGDPEAEALAGVLRTVPTAAGLIDYDAALGDVVRDVVAKQWAS